MKTNTRLGVKKTFKLYIGGEFPRSESGRTFRPGVDGGKSRSLDSATPNVAQASRKDLRTAVVVARKAQPGWAGKTAYLRSQILYRVAEMLEARRAQFEEEIRFASGATATAAREELNASIDRIVWYAGWADKYQTVLGSMNPVAGPFFNFSVAEPTGVIGVIAPCEMPLLALVSMLFPVIASGNTAVALVSENAPQPALSFGEVLATSDLPGGIVNLLSGYRAELLPHFAKHMDIAGIFLASQDEAEGKLAQFEGAENLKRVRILRKLRGNDWFGEKAQSPLWIEPFVEIKTIWHPIRV